MVRQEIERPEAVWLREMECGLAVENGARCLKNAIFFFFLTRELGRRNSFASLTYAASIHARSRFHCEAIRTGLAVQCATPSTLFAGFITGVADSLCWIVSSWAVLVALTRKQAEIALAARAIIWLVLAR